MNRGWVAVVAVALGVFAVGGVIAGIPSQPRPVASPVSTPAATPTPTAALTPTLTPSPEPATSEPVASGVLRVYTNNIENLVRNDADGACTQVGEVEHLESMLVDGSGRTGSGVVAPDLLLLQQVRGRSQADAYASHLSARFGFPDGTYRAIVAWDDPEEWGSTHDCLNRALGQAKKVQTNAIVYNSRTLTITDTSHYFSAGWLKPGTAYANGRGCTAYQPPSIDSNARRADKWKRTSAIAARFRIAGTSTTVFAASLHLPQQNRRHACAGNGDVGMDGSGIRLSAEATGLLQRSEVRVVGVDANRTGIAPSALRGYGLTGYGSGITIGHSKIDYLFVRGQVEPSSINHTVAGTRSNHLALYGFVDY
jgi:hypothetical protein